MYKDDRIEVGIRFEQADYVRQMEIYAGKDGEINPWRAVIVKALIALALIAGAVVSLLMGWVRSLISCALFAVIYIPWAIVSAVNVPKERKIRKAQYEEAKNNDDSLKEQQGDRRVGIYFFGRDNLFARHLPWDEAIPYRDFSRCVEYSDCLYFEREFGDGIIHTILIPARHLSAQTASEIISRIKEAKARYTCVSPICPADQPKVEKAEEELFDLSKHKLLCEVEYTLTPDEVKAAAAPEICLAAARSRLKAALIPMLMLAMLFASAPVLLFTLGGASREAYMLTACAVVMDILIFWATWQGNVSSVAKMQKKLLRAEARYGSRVALYEDLACVRTFGDDTLYLYNWLPEVFRAEGFVCIRNATIRDSTKATKSFFAVPVRALDDADDFIRILEDRIQAAFDGAIELAADPSAAAEELPESKPLRKEVRRGKKILSARYKGVDVCIRRRFRVTELIIDGFVYAEQKELIESAYELGAVVNGVMFAAKQREDGTVQLFAHGFEIVSGMHKI